MSLVGIAQEIVVEAVALKQELRPHDERELHLLDWNARALAVYGPLIEAHGTDTQQEIYRRHVVTAKRLVVANEFEDRLHAGMFEFAGEAAS